MTDSMATLSITAGAHSSLCEEDARLLRGLRAGIESAYEELLARYQQPVYNITYRLLGDQSDACDVFEVSVLESVSRCRRVSGAQQPSDVDLPDCRERSSQSSPLVFETPQARGASEQKREMTTTMRMI